MAYERLIRRTLWVSECPKCSDRVERSENPPRERLCRCGTWVRFEKYDYTGPEVTK